VKVTGRGAFFVTQFRTKERAMVKGKGCSNAVDEIMKKLGQLDLEALQAVERELDRLLAGNEEETHEVVCPVRDVGAAGGAALDGSCA
jgi:hypothetical protein